MTYVLIALLVVAVALVFWKRPAKGAKRKTKGKKRKGR
jgi:hypothetical protein